MVIKMNRITELLVSAMLVLSACSTVGTTEADRKTSAKDPSKIELNQPVHFSTADGNDVVVQAGTYQVQQAPNSQLQLVSSTAAPPILISAQATRSTSDVPKPVALGLLFESEVYHLILLLPGNNALEAHGSVSGVQSRGLLDARVFIKANKLVLQPTEPQPRPDLVPTCLRVEEINLGVSYLYFLHGGVLNQGAAAAAPSQARYASSTVPVQGLQPGQFQAVVFSFGIQSPPSSSLQVDSANQVPESNEQNNSGQQRC
jgi:hypothetical protein